MLRTAIKQMKTRYQAHLDLVDIHRVLFHRDQRQQLLHLVRTKLEFDVPTTTDVKHTSHACCLPTRKSAAPLKLDQFSLCHHERHHQRLLQVEQLSQTIVLKVVAQLSYRSENSDRLREYTVSSPRQLDPCSLIFQRQLFEHQICPFHQTLCQYLP